MLKNHTLKGKNRPVLHHFPQHGILGLHDRASPKTARRIRPLRARAEAMVLEYKMFFCKKKEEEYMS